MALHAWKVRTPPDAFTLTLPLYSTERYIRLTSSVVAPVPDANPVDVLTNAAPASAASTQAAILSSRVGMRACLQDHFDGDGRGGLGLLNVDALISGRIGVV